MTSVAEYMRKEQEMKRLQAEMRAMEMSVDIAQERAFREQLSALMRKYSKSNYDVMQIVAPYQVEKDENGSIKKIHGNKGRSRRVIRRTYKNPMNGQTCDHFGGRFPGIMKVWIEKWGREVVDTWMISEDGVNVAYFNPIIPEGEKITPQRPQRSEVPAPGDNYRNMNELLVVPGLSQSSFYA